VPVTAGIVGGTLVATAITDIDMSAEGRGAAGGDGTHRRPLLAVDRVPIEVGLAVSVENVRNL
jgi:hypothetical protein